jgi:putative membrane protein
MGRLLLRWILLAISVVVVSVLTSLVGLKLEAPHNEVADWIKLLVGVAILSFVNATFGRIIKFLTLPLNCLTLGLFSLIVNAAMLLLVASLDNGFTISGTPFMKFVTAFVGSLLISFVNMILGSLVPDKDEDE